MKIAIDTQTILGQPTGFGYYVKNLVESLQKIDSKNKYLLFATDQAKDLYTMERFLWDQFKFPFKSSRAKADILHQPCFSVPIFYRGKKVVTVHDIIPVLFPENLPLVSRLFYSKWMTFTYKYTDMIITDSQCTKNDLVKHLKINPEKIRVIYLAVSESFKPERSLDKLQKTKTKYKTGEKYFIHVGTLEPRKNLLFLVRAYAQAVKRGLKENLIIVGKKGWYYDDLFSLVKDLKLEKRVIFTGYADDQDIPALYSGATALTFPSVYEGFGFPPLEAMACGTPVITSNTSSLPEVVGEAGILLPPKDEKKWAENMLKLAGNRALSGKLREAGLKQAKNFSWVATAEQTIEVYEKMAAK